jgi:cellobiose phosphorylase
MPIWKTENSTEGTFSINNPETIRDLYFPLTNTQGKIYSCISPFLSGDIKKNQHQFLTYPATVFDLKNPFCIRTLWLCFDKKPALNISPFWPTKDKITLTAGPLWQKLTRINKKNNLRIETLNFVPENYPCEIMQIKISNKAKTVKRITPITSIPLFCRSEDNLRNHRHVSSLLNKAAINKQGIIVTPSMHFDERGHKKNKASYFVYGFTDKHTTIDKALSSLEKFIGPKGNLVFPQSINSGLSNPEKNTAGKENIAALQFKTYSLRPDSELNIFLILGITELRVIDKIFKEFNSPSKIITAFENSKKAWLKSWQNLEIKTNDNNFDFWLKWVNLQPELRKLFGCSFLPHFDYGKGGRGWRDLWQDFLTEILTDPGKIKNIILNNSKGIRIDGSNATIITGQGEFLSDRDKISRVWTDHGVWPFLVLAAYINRTKDYKILFQETVFFKDHQISRAKKQDLCLKTKNSKEYLLKDKDNKIYKSSLLDHILIQHLVQFFNTGPKGNIRLENGDWNDALDMAPDKGESVAFSCMYSHNLKALAGLLAEIKQKDKNIKKIEITQELYMLFDTLRKKINYNDPGQKQALLSSYFTATKKRVSGKKISLPLEKVIDDINSKAEWMFKHIKKKEWIRSAGIFNGYYDNKSRRVEGKHKNKIQVMLPSQTFPIFSGIADRKQIASIWKVIGKNLRFDKTWALRLNTDFKSLNLDLGRAFAFSYGDKENGSVFSHMNILTAYGLYKRGFIKEGFKIFHSLFQLAVNDKSQTGPCLPEYFNSESKGLYPYLTGSASWLIYLFTEQILGIKFSLGELILEPKLVKDQFIHSKTIAFSTILNKNRFTLTYCNPHRKSWPDYNIERFFLNKTELDITKGKFIRFDRKKTKDILNSPKIELKAVLA